MEKDIGKIKKNDIADIILRIDDFGERRGLTIREFITSDRYTGFTKSGVKIMASDFPRFKEMINSISDEDMQEEISEEEAFPEEQKTLDEETESTGKLKVPKLPERKEEVPGETPEEEVEIEKPGESLPDY